MYSACSVSRPLLSGGCGWQTCHLFERAVVVVKYFEGLHSWKNYPYVGYGHQLQRGERFTADMTERQADSLLRADLWKCFEHFKGYRKDALLLTLLAYNVGVGRLLGYGKHQKSRLLRKIEAGDRNFYWEYVPFVRYKGKVFARIGEKKTSGVYVISSAIKTNKTGT